MREILEVDGDVGDLTFYEMRAGGWGGGFICVLETFINRSSDLEPG